ncbi:MAG: glycosyl-4,4'-diaponeurosporenoate acyltransferase [Spartobacteria bacterium]|nr:glycosyl-4,4'-diaponeurosporenoate acyltransferase [Spartobacteria bacterium]
MIHLPPFWIVVLNVTGCFILQMGIAWGITQFPAGLFRPEAWLFRKRAWERDGRLYERFFRIRKWKALLPDAAVWFRGGFAKKNLGGRSPDYFRRFEQETCRGELAHWLQMACAPLFFLWNPLWAGWIMVGYFLLSSLPCILTQRFNRIRLAGRHRGASVRLHAGLSDDAQHHA